MCASMPAFRPLHFQLRERASRTRGIVLSDFAAAAMA
jgi:hypothetical protein